MKGHLCYRISLQKQKLLYKLQIVQHLLKRFTAPFFLPTQQEGTPECGYIHSLPRNFRMTLGCCASFRNKETTDALALEKVLFFLYNGENSTNEPIPLYRLISQEFFKSEFY